MSPRLRVAAVALVALFCVALPAVANARFTGRTTAGMTVGSDTLAAPTSLSVTKNCSLFNTSVTVSWSATTDTYATGYVLTTTQGSVETPTTIASRNTTSVTIDIGRYRPTTFAITSTYRSWSSTSSASTSPVQCNLLG